MLLIEKKMHMEESSPDKYEMPVPPHYLTLTMPWRKEATRRDSVQCGKQHTLFAKDTVDKNFTVDVNPVWCGLFLSPTPPHTSTLMLTQLYSEHVDGTNFAEKQQSFQNCFQPE